MKGEIYALSDAAVSIIGGSYSNLELTNEIKEINKSLKDYKAITLVFDGKKFTREPHIWDFYNPSDEMKEYMTLTIGTIGLVGGWTGEKIISQLL